jgi:CelD/BcsL family acetyltransferase involved in cellulose biosynthesis
MFSKHSDFIFVKFLIDNQIAAYFLAIKNSSGYCIVPTLLHDRKYDFYTPGLLMIYEFLNQVIESKQINVFDLSRGNEKYKFRYLPSPETYTNGLFYFHS